MNENIDFDDTLAPPKTIQIKGNSGATQSFTFYPLPFDYMPKVWKLFRKMSEMRVANPEMQKLDKVDLMDAAQDVFDLLDEETTSLLRDLVSALMKFNFPKLQETKRDRFCTKYWFTLYPLLLELHVPLMDESMMSEEMKTQYEVFMKELNKKDEPPTTKQPTREQTGSDVLT